MEKPVDTQNVQELIARYNQELLALHKRQQPTPPVAVPAATPPIVSEPADDFTPPNVGRDLAAMTTEIPSVSAEDTSTSPHTDSDLHTEEPRAESPITPPAEETAPFTGYLRVYVFSGNGAEPLQGARVAVSRRQGDNDILFANVSTDRDGFTPVIPLPSVNPELSMRPDMPNPYVPYDIQVEAVGFVPAVYDNVPVYGNTYVTQPAAMVPLVAGSTGNETRRFESGGPTNL